jgi:hypothetical protein
MNEQPNELAVEQLPELLEEVREHLQEKFSGLRFEHPRLDRDFAGERVLSVDAIVSTSEDAAGTLLDIFSAIRRIFFSHGYSIRPVINFGDEEDFREIEGSDD